MKRAWMKKVKAIPACGTNNNGSLEQKAKQAQPKLRRQMRTSAAIIGLAILIGEPNLLLTLQSDRTPAAEPPLANEPVNSATTVANEPVNVRATTVPIANEPVNVRADKLPIDSVTSSVSATTEATLTQTNSWAETAPVVEPIPEIASFDLMPSAPQLLAQAVTPQPTAPVVVETETQQAPAPKQGSQANEFEATTSSVKVDLPHTVNLGVSSNPDLGQPQVVTRAQAGTTSNSQQLLESRGQQKVLQTYRTNRLVQKLKASKTVTRQQSNNLSHSSYTPPKVAVKRSVANYSSTVSPAISGKTELINRLKQKSYRSENNLAKLRFSEQVRDSSESASTYSSKSLQSAHINSKLRSINQAKVMPPVVVETTPAVRNTRNKVEQQTPQIPTVAASPLALEVPEVTAPYVVETIPAIRNTRNKEVEQQTPQIPAIAASPSGSQTPSSVVVETTPAISPTRTAINSSNGVEQPLPQTPPIAASPSAPEMPLEQQTPSSVVVETIPPISSTRTATNSSNGVEQPPSQTPPIAASPSAPEMPLEQQTPSSVVVETTPATKLLTRSPQVDNVDHTNTVKGNQEAQPQTVYVIADGSKSNVNQPNVTLASLTVGYKVKSGDTLSAIARRYKVDLVELVDANRISNPDRLSVNQDLVIPTASSRADGQITAAARSQFVNTAGAIAINNNVAIVPPGTSSINRRIAQVTQNKADISYNLTAVSQQPTGNPDYSGMGGSISDNTESVTSPPSFYAQELQTDVQKLRQKYSAAHTFTQNVPASVDPVVTPIAVSTPRLVSNSSKQINRQFPLSADEPINPEFVMAQATPTQRRKLPQLTAQSTVVTKSKARLATAPLDADTSESLQSFGRQQVSPELPPLGAVDTYLPKPAANPFTGYIWPAKGVLTSGYGWRWGRMHKGIDVAAPIGTPIFAAASGVVIRSGWNSGGYGNLVDIKHPDGSFTRYAHNKRLLVQAGQEVQQGQQISEMGNTGFSTGPHLHFEVHPTGKGAVNPIAFLPSDR